MQSNTMNIADDCTVVRRPYQRMTTANMLKICYNKQIVSTIIGLGGDIKLKEINKMINMN